MAKSRTEELTAMVADAVHTASDTLSEHVDKVKEATAPFVAEAKDVLTDKAEQAKDAIAEAVEHVQDAAHDKTADLSVPDLKVPDFKKPEITVPEVSEVRAVAAAKFADVKDAVTDKTSDVAAQAPSLSVDDMRAIFQNEWLPQVKDGIAAATAAGAAAVAHAGSNGRALVGMAPKKKRGKFLIAVGLVGLAAAGGLIVASRRKQAKKSEPQQAAADIAAQVEETTAKLQAKATDAGDRVAAKSDDAVAGVEKALDSAIDQAGETTRRDRRASKN